jgi:membrane protein DedA with SNARE-associated domain
MRARTVSKSPPSVAPVGVTAGVLPEREGYAGTSETERLDSWLVTDLLLGHGLLILFALVAVESAGVPLPGETALIAAGVLASQGRFHSIEVVIVVAAIAAIVGDNVGYWIGRKGGRGLLQRTPFVRDAFERALPPAERFFERHGPKTVFLGRFVAFLRITSAWLAGISQMPWWRFFFWNALGGIVWAALVGVVAYKFGEAAAKAVNKYGLYGGIAVVVVLAILYVVFRIWKKRMLENPET